MSTLELFKTIQSSDFSRYIGGQNHLFGAFYQLIHIVGLVMVLSSIILLSLRVLGGGVRQQSLRQITQSTSWLIWVGLALLAFSGLLIFIPAATNYYPNSVFWSKFVLLALALFLHNSLYQGIGKSDEEPSIVAKLAATFSLVLWFSVAFAGRFIGFV
ncbi:hypothetical protein IVG45_07760 [Methylomonas sp. LL1]|uniref:DUF6644 family protein n=1 Tax=Methylomonas sp. LL1 TaxID=2785785 RepID=UPI0018C3AC32|nr:DUF6644 family protein [Methylomonas sp. LL1]QPK64826.1 hypothetical protein IVG45_07760 [Methylomonas sp. LL1]